MFVIMRRQFPANNFVKLNLIVNNYFKTIVFIGTHALEILGFFFSINMTNH